jgi:hypothetical protein
MHAVGYYLMLIYPTDGLFTDGLFDLILHKAFFKQSVHEHPL